MNLPSPLDWLPRSNAVNLLAGLFLLTALVAAARRHARACISAYAWNSIALAGVVAAVAAASGSPVLWVAAPLALAIKGFALPRLLRHAIGGPGADDDTGPVVSGGASLAIGGALAVIAFGQVRDALGPAPSIAASCLPVTVAVALVGLFLMASRRRPLARLVGLALVENAVFLSVVALARSLPLVIATGLLLDLLAGAALAGLHAARSASASGVRAEPGLTPPEG